MGVTIFRGLHPQLRPQAARLYWDAFGGKLGRVLGPDDRAVRFFERVIRGDLCFSAVGDGGELIGLAGYKTTAGSFAGGTCVARAHRGKGIGSQLLAALYQEAVERGYGAVRLDVIQDNWRARALYERQGFRAVRTEELGVLRFLFGFASSTTMVRPVG
jgi:GNAT superfamily N-acetyltransferase